MSDNITFENKISAPFTWVENELIQAKLLLRKQEHISGGKFPRTLYRILSLNDNYEEIYKEFIGEETQNQQTLDNAKF